jgi:glycosyltransferase involved in cell wall biosynthesis
MRRSTYDVCAVVISDLAYDARVWKQARSLSNAGLSVRLIGCSYDIDATRVRTEDGIHVVEVPLGSRTGRVSRIARARTLLQVYYEVLRTPARAYHVHNVHPGLAGVLASRLRRARLVYDAHELYGEPTDGSLAARAAARATFLLERLMVRIADAAVTTNPSRAEVLSARHGVRDVAVLRNVPSLQREVEPLDPGFPAGVRVLLYQGGIYAKSRAFRQTVQALSDLPDDIHLVILGFGREDDISLVRSWAEEFAVTERVHLLPPRPFDELVRTAAAATLGLVPIRPIRLNHTLGDTNKLHEYLMAGLPIVASDLPEIRHVARQGDPPVGEIFDPDDSASIAAAVRRILSDEGRLARRRSEALRLARELYNWDVEQHKLLDLYRQLNGGTVNGGTANGTGATT